MSLLDIVVSADSAPVHLASALGLPVVALFEDRPEKYLRWHPLGVEHVIQESAYVPAVAEGLAVQLVNGASHLAECPSARPVIEVQEIVLTHSTHLLKTAQVAHTRRHP